MYYYDVMSTDDVTSSHPIHLFLAVYGIVWGGHVIDFGCFYWTKLSEVG